MPEGSFYILGWFLLWCFDYRSDHECQSWFSVSELSVFALTMEDFIAQRDFPPLFLFTNNIYFCLLCLYSIESFFTIGFLIIT